MGRMASPESGFLPLRIAILVVSDTRTLETDTSGALLEEGFRRAGHEVVERRIVPDDVEAIRAWVTETAERARVLVVTGGTGVTRRDVTPEAVETLFEKPLPGFGELFRWLSYEEIGSATIQSRATAGVLPGARLLFALPGSRNACRLALDRILLPQLDARTRPCSFAGLLERMERDEGEPN